MENHLLEMLVNPGSKVDLNKFRTQFNDKGFDKDAGLKLMEESILTISRLQDTLYAQDRYSVLIILQAMDAAGKDGAIKHVMKGLNPQGVNVHPFKVPTHKELDHDYMWRHYKALPGRGEIALFNRSHYENVLVTRVHPEYVLNERIPGIKTVEDVNEKFWEKRFKHINNIEEHLVDNGTIIIKLFLHLSYKEQRKRLIERIDAPDKNWKFSTADVKERKLWKNYMHAYEEMLTKTSTDHAPWYVVPADNKWFTRLSIANILERELEKYDLKYPVLSAEETANLQSLKQSLLND